MRSVLAVIVISISMLPACVAIPPEKVSSFDDFANWYLLDDLTYDIGELEHDNKIVVPTGFVTDYASIPRSACLFMPKDGVHSRAAIIHDYLYWEGAAVVPSRDHADMVMYLAMYEQGVDFDTRETIYAQLSNFGKAAWEANHAERVGGLPRVIPETMIAELESPTMAGERTWDAFRPKVATVYANGSPGRKGSVNVDWSDVESQFAAAQLEGAPPWWAVWSHLKFWQW